MLPPAHVLDLFAVPQDPRPLTGGQGQSVVAGDLVLSPGRGEAVSGWLCPPLARLAVELDTASHRALRIAMPIPARDGRWVVDGWGASRYEPDSRPCHDLDVLVATAHLLHARFAAAFPTPPPGVNDRDDRWARAARVAFGDRGVSPLSPAPSVPGAMPAPPRSTDAATDALVTTLLARLTDADLGRAQLVHADLAGNVLLDTDGIPVVIDVAPQWRPPLWAEAVCVLDAVLWQGADGRAMQRWRSGVHEQAMLRAAVFRLLSDEPADADAYARVLGIRAAGG